jgi:VanZ family protein
MAFVLGYPRRWLWVLLTIGLAITLLEAFQLLIPFRHASLIDWAVKVVGALVGVCGGKIAGCWFASRQWTGKEPLV